MLKCCFIKMNKGTYWPHYNPHSFILPISLYLPLFSKVALCLLLYSFSFKVYSWPYDWYLSFNSHLQYLISLYLFNNKLYSFNFQYSFHKLGKWDDDSKQAREKTALTATQVTLALLWSRGYSVREGWIQETLCRRN